MQRFTSTTSMGYEFIRGKWDKEKRNFSSVSQCMYIANMLIFIY